MRRLGGLLLVLAVSTLTVNMAGADARHDRGVLDALDMPAVASPLAPRALLNGLARAGERIVAVGQRGHVLYSDDAGGTWQQAAVPVSSDLVAVSFPSPSKGWAVGHDGVVLHTQDAGATWSRQLDGHVAGELLLEAYPEIASPIDADAEPAAVDVDIDAAVDVDVDVDVDTAEAESSDAVDPAVALHAEAQRFADQGAENPFLDVFFSDERTGYVVGAFGLILQTSDAGATWQPRLHAVDNPGGLHLYAIRGVGSDVYIVGEQGLALRLNHESGRFERLELPYQGTLFGVIGDDRGVVAFGLRGTVLRSADRGATWQQVETGLQVGMTSGTVDADGRFVIVSQAGHALASDDGGASFALVPVSQPLPAAAVVVATGGKLVVAGPRGVRTLPAAD